jgi:outer membrane protein assembly factor BamB
VADTAGAAGTSSSTTTTTTQGAEERVVVVGAHDGVLSCRLVSSGRKKWATRLAASTSQNADATSDPIFAAPFIFRLQGERVGVAVATQSGLLAVCDLSNGEVLASIRLPGQLFSSPVVLALNSHRQERHDTCGHTPNSGNLAEAAAESSKTAATNEDGAQQEPTNGAVTFRVLIGCRDDHMYGLDFAE